MARFDLRTRTRRLALLGLFSAGALLLSFLESLLPPMPFLPPGAKLGLSNIAVMLAVGLFSLPQVLSVVVIKAGFALLTRGVTAGIFSFAGGVVSACVMFLLWHLPQKEVSFVTISVSGAICHNIAQLCVSAALLGSSAAFYYLPVVLTASVVFGIVNGIFVRPLVKALQRALPQVYSVYKNKGRG